MTGNLNVAVRESVIDRKVAYSVEVPIVSGIRGVPDTVTDSLKFTTKFKFGLSAEL